MSRFSVDAIFKATDRFSAPIKRMSKRMDRFTRSAKRGLKGANRIADGVVRGMRKVAMAAGAAAAAVGFVFADVFRTGAEFEQSLTNAAAKFPGQVKKGTAAFDALKAAAADVGATTEWTASQAAEGLNYLAMAGFNTEQAIAALPGAVNLATAAQIDLGRATDIATDTLGAFNLMTNDTAQLQTNLARVSDALAKTTTSANTTMEDMFEAIKKVGPVASKAGASIEEVSAGIGILANAGIKGGEAGTALRNMLLRLAAPASAGRKALAGLGVKATDASGTMRPMAEIIGDLAEKTKNLSDKAKLKALDAIFGKRTIGPALILMEAGQTAFEDFTHSVEAAGGSSNQMAATMRDTVSGSVKGLSSAIESVKIQIFDMNSGPLKDVIDNMTEWVRTNRELIATKIGDFVANLIENLPTIWKWFKRIAATTATLLALATAVKVITAAVTAWKYAAIALNFVLGLNPLVLIIAAILGGLALIIAYWPEITAMFTEFWQALKLVGNDIASFFGEIVDGIVGKIGGAIDLITNAGSTVAGWFGFGGDEASSSSSASVSSPQERTARSVSEHRSYSESALTIRDETGRAVMSRPPPAGANISLQSSGAF